MRGPIVIYQSADKKVNLEIQLQEDTIWLTQRQMAELFGTEVPAISKHVKNIYATGELKARSTVSKMETVRKEGKRQIKRTLDHYSLDVVISVGYRVNSKRGTQFRIWANNVLKQYLVEGYALNEKRLKETQQKYNELQQAVKLVAKVSAQKAIGTQESQGILKILAEFSRALDLLDQYDHQELTLPSLSATKEIVPLTYKEAKKQIEVWRKAQKAGKLFGNEKDNSFEGSLKAIHQTFDGEELYPSFEEKAAHLLYFIVKNHSFSDGNKRIGAGLFVYFLDRNGALFSAEGIKVIDDNALVALTLLIAESKPEEKDIMIKVIVNLIYEG